MSRRILLSWAMADLLRIGERSRDMTLKATLTKLE